MGGKKGGGGGIASFVKGRQCGTWCTITPATRAHGVRIVPGVEGPLDA